MWIHSGRGLSLPSSWHWINSFPLPPLDTHTHRVNTDNSQTLQSLHHLACTPNPSLQFCNGNKKIEQGNVFSGQTTPGPITLSCTPPETHAPHQLRTTSPYSSVSLTWYLLVLAHCHVDLHLLQLLVPKPQSSKISRCFWWHYTLFCSGLLQSYTYRNLCRVNPRKAIH